MAKINMYSDNTVLRMSEVKSFDDYGDNQTLLKFDIYLDHYGYDDKELSKLARKLLKKASKLAKKRHNEIMEVKEVFSKGYNYTNTDNKKEKIKKSKLKKFLKDCE